MQYFFFVLIFSAVTKCVFAVCDDPEFLEINYTINLHYEIIGDKLLSKYGDVTADLKNLVHKFNQETSSVNNKIKNQEEEYNVLNEKENELKNKSADLFDQIKNLREKLSITSIESINFDGNNVQPFDDSILEYWNEIKKIEDQLAAIYNDNETNLYNKIMNIPHSVSEDLSFIENGLDDGKDDHCAKDLDEELNTLFKELSTLLQFDEIVQDIADLSEAADKKDKEATDQLLFINKLPKKETEAKNLEVLTNNLVNLLEETQEILKDLNLKTLLEVKPLIQATETEIEEYINDAHCYREYFMNCPSDKVLPKCMENCKSENMSNKLI